MSKTQNASHSGHKLEKENAPQNVKKQIENQNRAIKKLSQFLKTAKSLFWVLSIFVCSTAVAQTKLYVDVNASGNNNGSSWANAYVDLQDALDAHMSSNVDQILIAEGAYIPTSAPDGSTSNTRDRAFHLANDDVLIAGGYDPSTGNQTGDPTILSGDNISANTVADNCYHVFVLYDLTSATSINNVTITKGRANGSGSMTYMSQTISRIDGAGVYSKSCSAGFNNVVFTTNKANYYGGGMYGHSCSSNFVNVVFYADTANTSGGAYANPNGTSHPTFTNTLFAHNKAYYGGAVVNTGGADITLVNASFFENTGNLGGAVYAQSGCDLTLKNTFFYKNSAGAGKDIQTSGTYNASNTNNATYQGTSGYLNLSSYAYTHLFTDYSNLKGSDGIWMTPDDGLVPTTGSVLLKAGSSAGTPALDINGSTRPGTKSIGAYDFPVPEAITVAANKITFTSAHLNCLVNPSNNTTTVSFEYGTTTAYGSSVAVSGTFTGASTQFISKELTGLQFGEGYHYRVKAQNAFGITYGRDQYFITGGTNTLDGGLHHSIVLTTNGLVHTFGDNTYGQLGDSSVSTSSGVPIKVLKGAYSGTTYLGDDPSNPIIAVSAGDNYNLALAADGTVFAWGDYSNGQLGAGSLSANAAIPVQVLKGAYSGTTYLGDDSNNPIIAISAGANHNLVLTANGEVLAFGNNSNGKQGDNTTTAHNVPIQVLKGAYSGTTYLGDDSNNPIIAISAGTNHSLTLGANGMVYSFGNNSSGRLGNGNTTQQKLPVLMVSGDYGGSGSIGDSTANPVIAISAGHDHSIVLTANGRVYGCGWNGYGALGTGNNTIHSSPAAMIAGTYSASLTYMGEDPNNPITAILAGYQNAFVSTLEGEIHTMGYSPYGGNGVSGAYKFTPLTVVGGAYGTSSSFIGDVSSNPVTAMAKGKSHSLVATKDGSVYAFGSVANGKLGNPGITGNQYPPVEVYDLKSISVPSVYAIQANKITYSSARLHALVNPNGKSTTISFEYGKTISYGSTATVSGTKNGHQKLYTSTEVADLEYGVGYHFRMKAVNSHGITYGQDRYFITGSSSVTDGGESRSLALTNSGLVYNNFKYQVQKGAYPGTTYLGDDPENPIVAISMGATHYLALAADGVVYSWGEYGNGRLGVSGLTSNISQPIKVEKGAYNGTSFLGDNPANPIISISSGRSHNLALASNGEVYSFGYNSNGQLGDNTTTTRTTPVKVIAGEYEGTTTLGDDLENPIVAISAGVDFSLALTANGQVCGFGKNSSGQLGNGKNDNIQKTPVYALKGTGCGHEYLGDDKLNAITSLSAGFDHSLALAASGLVYSFGDYKGLGSGFPHSKNIPIQVIAGAYSNSVSYLGAISGNPVVIICAGYQNSFCITSAGSVYSFGISSYGALGTGNLSFQNSAVKVVNGEYGSASSNYLGDESNNKAISVSAYSYHTHISTESGQVFSFGKNRNGQLGDGTTVDRWTPVTSTLDLIGAVIANGLRLSDTDGELTLTSETTSGFALQDVGDVVRFIGSDHAFEEVSTDLPAGNNLLKRYAKYWHILTPLVGTWGGSIDFEFDLGHNPSPDYSYYLLKRDGTSGDFFVPEDYNYKISDNKVIFSIDIFGSNDSYYTIGRSDEGAGYALDFDGVNDYVRIPQPALKEDFTIEYWMRTTQTGPSGTDWEDGAGIIDRSSSFSTNNDYGTALVGSKLLFGVGTPNVSISSTTDVNTGKWVHVAATRKKSTGYLELYINGVLESSTTSGYYSNTSVFNIEIGKLQGSGSSHYYEGELDEIRLWNYVRTADQIKKNFRRSLVGDDTGLEMYYKFDQTKSFFLPDVSAHSRQALLYNFSLTGTTSNWIESTAPIGSAANALKLMGPGNALDFDGSNDKVKLTNLKLDPDNGNGFSAEAWIKPTISSTAVHIMLSQQDGTGKGRTLFSINKDGKLSSYINGSFKIGSSVLTSGEWAHVVLVYNGAQVKMYLNGIVDGTFSSGADAADGSWVLGSGKSGGSYFDGLIDDLRIWTDERTQTEIQDNMYASLNGDEAGLEAYYHFDHSTGSTLEDQTTNGYDGTLVNFSGTYWVSAANREPFKTVRSGAHSSGTTWKAGTAPSSSSDKLAVFHDLTLGSTGTYSRLQVNSGKTITANADVTVTGEVIVNGTAAGSNKLILGGSSKQTLGGSGTIGDLQVNNSNDVSLEGDLTLNGALTLTSGDIEVNDHTLTLGGTTSHGSASSYLKINGTGKVKTTVGSDPVIIPIGRNPYLPVVIDDGGGAEFTVGVADGVYSNPTANTTEITTEVVSETWTIQASQAASNVIVQLGWDAAQESSLTRLASGIGYWENGVSSSWNRPSLTTTATGSDPYFQTRTIDFSTRLHYFGVGGPSSALPVELIYFTAQWQEQGKSAQLTWQTTMEENNSHFEIQRTFGSLSVDAERSRSGAEGNWQTIGRVEGAGNSMGPINYTYTDKSPSLAEGRVGMGQPTTYYRLKQVDYNGNFEYSQVRTLKVVERSRDQTVSIYPNPTNSIAYIQSDQAINQVMVLDMHGRTVLSQGPSNKIDVGSLPKGTYIIKIQSGNNMDTQKLQVN